MRPILTPLLNNRWVFAGACGAAVLGGCAFDAGSLAHPSSRPPAMPTMLPAPDARQAAVNEAEILAAALELARRQEFLAALKKIEPLTEPAARLRLQKVLGATLADEDPAVAARLALALAEGPARDVVVERAARLWAQRDAATVTQWALELADPMTAAIARRAVARELVRTEPRRAIERLLALPARAARDEIVVFAAAAWARLDADAAVGWLRELSEDELRSRAAPGIGFEIAQTDPRRAITLAETLSEGRDRWLLFSAIGQTWAAVDSRAALEWARTRPAGEARVAASSGVDTGLGVPGSRRRANGPDTRGLGIRSRSGGAVLGAMSAIDTPEFLAWLATQPKGMSRDEAILDFVRQRSPATAVQLGPWVAALPGGPTRDRAMEIFAESLISTSPREAADWLRQLPRSDRSDEWVERTARQWLATNPAAAEAWLRDMPLAPERKSALLRDAGR